MDGTRAGVEGLYRLIAEYGPWATSVHDLDGRYRWASPAFEWLLGIPPEELVGRDAYELFHPEDVRPIQVSHETIVDLPTTYTVNYRIRKADDTYRWVESISHVVEAEELIVSVTRPLDDQRSAIEAVQAERVIADRLQAFGLQQQQFLTTISHRTRQPLTVVLGMAEALLAQWRHMDAGTVDEMLARLLNQARRLEDITRDVTEADRLARGALGLDIRPVELARLAQLQVAELAAPEASISVDISPRTLVFADVELVGILLRILIENAIKHTPLGTRVWIRAQRAGDGLVLIVEDDGPGVDPARRHLIFEPFQRGDGDDPDPGLGLGLHTVAHIAATHRGRAWTEDRPGGGASFRVLFPATRTQPPDALLGAAASDEDPSVTRKR